MGRRVIGIRTGTGAVLAGDLREEAGTVEVLAGLEEFWADPAVVLAGRPGTGELLDVSSVDRVPPVPPGAKVFCIGLNYLEHVAEGSYSGDPLPSHPTLFGRWPSSLGVGDSEIPIPAGEDGLDWEGEVVAYVGTTLADATAEEALAAVLGYSTFNDVTARRAQKLTSQWTLGKNADRSGPLGPIVPAAEVGDLRAGLSVQTLVNGETVQSGSTDQMVYTVGETLAHISRTVTLRPGDLLATGTPAGVGYARTPPWLLQPGDVVEVRIERLGSLRNTIVGHRGGTSVVRSGAKRSMPDAHVETRSRCSCSATVSAIRTGRRGS